MPQAPTAHLHAGYDSTPIRRLLDQLGFHGEIAGTGVPAPVQVGGRWVVEQANSWMNDYGTLRCCTDRDTTIADFYLYLVVIRRLIQQARTRYRWPTRPTTKRLK